MTSIVSEKNKKSRDIRFDILKAIGLLLIILAHTDPPQNIDLIRQFDVPMMVIASGTLFYYSSGNKNVDLWDYLRKRIPRLLAPVWLFLTFFFASAYIADFLTKKPYHFSSQELLFGFLLLDGINYVWIIRVFLLIAIVAPFLLKLYRFLGNETRFAAVIVAIYIFHEVIAIPLLYSWKIPYNWTMWRSKFYMYLIPYSCLFGLGMTLIEMNKKLISLILSGSAIGFLFYSALDYSKVGSALFNFWHNHKNDYKFPPSIIFILYGILMSIVLYLLVSWVWENYREWLENHRGITETIVFISSSSLWIYLWHIFFLEYWHRIQYKYPIMQKYLVIFISIAFLAIATTYLQKVIVSKIIKTTQFGQNNSEILATLFLK